MLEFVAARVKSHLSAEHFAGLHTTLTRERNTRDLGAAFPCVL